MEYLRLIILLFHLVGFALLLGGWAAEAFRGRRQVTRVMNLGLGLAAVAGLILAAPWGLTHELNYVKLGVKLVILLIIGAIMGIGQSRARKTGGDMPAGLFWSIGLLTLLNAALAVLWR